ncbi:hypothetical protein [Pedobacter sp. Leaf41]|uniref:hypothetical protein n=1 Tax=Pedobacter sp. Leaf41 TaxID=1736218 RepID=UPI0012FBEF44|nr:hypothetical protein [Pedobacter sp. Leaf41]
MKKNILILWLSILSLNSMAQIKKNSIYLEALGNGVVYSLNYDRIIPISNQIKLVPRLGFEYIPRSNPSVYGKFNVPIELNILYHQNNSNPNFAEAGLGLGLFSLFNDYKYSMVGDITEKTYKLAKVTTLRLGYRHQKPAGGLMYRAGILVRLTQDEFSKSRVGDDLFYVIWPGFSIGYTF